MDFGDKISFFDGATVAMIVIGVLLSGTMLFMSLPQTEQNMILSSLEFLDLHQQGTDQAETFAFMTGAVNQFYDRFYVAFVEIASVDPDLMPELAWRKTFETFVGLGHTVAENYSKPHPVYSFKHGNVLGIYIEN